MTPANLPATEVLVTADCWAGESSAETIVHRAIEAAASMVDADTADAEVAVMLTDDAGIRTLNNNWRGIDKPTNVLSFPALQPERASADDDAPRMLGDIAIAYETTRKEADSEHKPFDTFSGSIGNTRRGKYTDVDRSYESTSSGSPGFT